MIIFRYDKTFDGLLSAVFDAYSRKTFPEKLLGEKETEPLFVEEVYLVITAADKATRVWNALQKKVSKEVCNMLMYVWLSEQEGCDELLFRCICKLFDSRQVVAANFSDNDMLQVHQIARQVNRERLYIMQFVRFQKTLDNIYFAPVAPIYNALPLAIEHFVDRFSDQKWLIYDTKRHYGYYYDLTAPSEITLDSEMQLMDGKLVDAALAEDEKLFQELWRGYFQAMSIKERLNKKLQRQNMPVRFWRYLTEKQGGL